jgi:hypothetical protein
VVIGEEAGGYNGASGSGSFSSSTLIGYQAGNKLVNGAADNTFIGWKAGYTVTTGTGNIVIGYGKDTSAAAASNELNIGDLIVGKLDGSSVTVRGDLYANHFYGDGSILTGLAPRVSQTVALPGTVDGYVEIGSFDSVWGSHLLHVGVNVSISGFVVAKQYILPLYYNHTSNTWQDAIPFSNSGVYNNNDFALEVRVDATTVYLRLRKTGSNTTSGTAYVSMESKGIPDLFSPATGPSGTSGAHSLLPVTLLTQTGGNVGIGILAPSYRLDVAGDVRSTGSYYGDGSNLTGVIHTETDPAFSGSEAYNITATSTSRWNTAYGWGNWSTNGLATGTPVYVESDPNWGAVSNTVVYSNTPTYTDTVAKASAALPKSGGTTTGGITNIYGYGMGTNLITMFGGVLNGTNGVYWTIGTNEYWMLFR